MSYKSWSWQPCKYLCSQARLKLTAEDMGNWEWSPTLLSTLTQYSSSSLALFLLVSSLLQTTHVYSLLTSDCLNRGSREPWRPVWWCREAHRKHTTTAWWVFCVLQKWVVMNAKGWGSTQERTWLGWLLKMLGDNFQWIWWDDRWPLGLERGRLFSSSLFQNVKTGILAVRTTSIKTK